METISVYQSVLREIVMRVKGEELVCVLLEKPGYKAGNVWKNGFHLHFPYIFLKPEYHVKYLIPKVKDMLGNTYKDFNIDNVIDKGYVKSNWLLYGCVKGENMDGYKITNVFDGDGLEVQMYDVFKDYEIFDGEQNRIKITKENFEECIPRILSVRIWGRNYEREVVKELKQDNLIIEVKKASSKRNNMSKRRSKLDSNNLELCEKLLTVISDERADDHNESRRIGCAIYNISGGSKKGLEMWKLFSSRITTSHKTRGNPGNFNFDYCDKMWENLDGSNCTMGTIKYYAQRDNKKKYNSI